MMSCHSRANRYSATKALAGLCLLADEDRISLGQLAATQVQEWCLSRIAQYQDDDRRLAKEPEVFKNKSHMRALRSVYNDAAPINRHLLPEMLMQIFSHVHPAVVPRSHIPMLRVCRYWRRLLFRTSEFWDNLLSLPTWDGWNSKYHVGPFRAALVRSASANLVLSVPYYSEAVASILIPHASRLSSFKAGPTLSNPEEMALSRLKEEILYRTRRRYGLYMYGVVRKEEWRTSAVAFSFPLFPNLQSLELQQTYIRTPIAPYLALSHLKLDQCAIRPLSSHGPVAALIAVHAALESFPNLEVLSLIRCLSPPYYPDGLEEVSPVPDLKETMNLPRLCHLELVDTPAYIPPFLSHLVFPTTTSLVLEPTYAHDGSQGPAVVPLFPRINPSPSPSADAELTLSLHFPAADGRSLACWETRGSRMRPVRVTLPHAAFTSALVARFTRELAGALAPRRGVAALAVHGRFRHREVQSDPVEYWDEVMRALPDLRHLACETVWSTRAIVAALGRREDGGGFSCARLGEVVLGWSLTHGIDLGHGGGQWRALQRQDDGSPRDDRISASAERQPSRELSPESQLAKELYDFCDTVRPCLAARAGHCEPIGKLVVSFHCDYFRCKCRDTVLEGWQAALIEQRLRDALGDLVGEVVVGGRVD